MTLPRVLLITNQQDSPLPLLDSVTRALGALPDASAIVLVREKHLEGGELVSLVKSLRDVTRRHGALLAVSTRLDVAIAADADAVHLGGDAPAYADVRRLAPKSMRLGVSLHADEVAPPNADWAFLSPVFPTSCKPGAAPLGLERFKLSRERNANVPVFALGGVDASNAKSCLEAGAWGVAVRGAVLSSTHPEEAAARLFEALKER